MAAQTDFDIKIFDALRTPKAGWEWCHVDRYRRSAIESDITGVLDWIEHFDGDLALDLDLLQSDPRADDVTLTATLRGEIITGQPFTRHITVRWQRAQMVSIQSARHGARVRGVLRTDQIVGTMWRLCKLEAADDLLAGRQGKEADGESDSK